MSSVIAAAAAMSLLAATATAPVDDPAAENLVVERKGKDRGLAIENVTAILQDRTGFLWIGTRQGLVLYDGDSATTFEHDIGDPTSLGDNVVRTLYEDRDGNLWIGTNSSGLDRLDRDSWTFDHHRHDSADPATISHDSVNVILQDREGTLWVGTQIGLNRFDASTGKFERFLSDPGNPAALAHDYVYALCEDRDGRFWVATVGGGLDRLDRESKTFTHMRHDPDDPRTIVSDTVFCVVEDGGGRLWIGTRDGLDMIDRERLHVEHYTADARLPGGLTDALITAIAIDGHDTLWIGTWGGGLNRLDLRTGRFLPSPARAEPALSAARVIALAIDRAGAIWAGTWAHGLIRIKRPALGATLLTTDDGLSSNDVTAVLEDEAGRVWAGTWGGGLNLRPSGSSMFDPAFRAGLGQLVEGGVVSLESTRDGAAWVGAMGALFRSSTSGETLSLSHDPRQSGSLGEGYVTALLRDSGGALWVGVGGSGLYRLRLDGRTFDAFRHDPNDAETLSDDYITSLVEDRQGVLWVGTRSGGVNEIDRSTGRCVRHLPDPADRRSLSYHYVTAMAEDDMGTVYVATAGGGLNAARRTGDRVVFDRFTKREGLFDDTIRSLATDGSIVWLATADRLTRFDPTAGTFDTFDATDGLPTTGFNSGAACTGREHLYFGSSNGLLIVPRGLPAPVRAPAPTVVRAIRTVEGAAPIERAPWTLDRLEVPYGEILSFAFAVLDFDDARHHRFAYRLTGVRDNWIEIGDRREVTFADLDPGRYRLEVRGRSAHGVWSEARRPLTLVVVPPFWMTIWFRTVVLALLALTAFAAHRVRLSVLERRNRELVALKDQREAALTEMRASQEELHGTYERLRRLTRRLEAAKEDERQRISRELHDEMGQALTAAKINLQLIASTPDTDEIGERATDTIDLIDRMIRHVRALSLDLRPPLLDELGLGTALRSYLEAQARRSGLVIDVASNGIRTDLPAEIGITAFRFVQEAVTNVIRHAQACRVGVSLAQDDDHLIMSVRDDGRGFNVDQALARAASGRHLGLLGLRERVESLGGRLDIEAEPGRGTLLTVSIPWRER